MRECSSALTPLEQVHTPKGAPILRPPAQRYRMARASMHIQRVAAEQKWTETASRKSQYKGVTHQRDLGKLKTGLVNELHECNVTSATMGQGSTSSSMIWWCA